MKSELEIAEQDRSKRKSLAAGKEKTPTLVRMERDPAYGEPTTADVHPDEVANWLEHNWQIVE